MKNLVLILCFLFSVFTFGQVRTIAQLETDFNTVYAIPGNDNRAGTLARSLSGGANQEHHYMSWDFYGMIRAWQATGRTDLFNDCKQVIDNTISTATDTIIDGTNYKHWAADPTTPAGATLWDMYYLKEVTTFLRVVHQSRELYEANKTWLDNTVSFFEKNIWERYEENVYDPSPRSLIDAVIYSYDPYLSSLSARSAMEFWTITKKQKYKTYMDNINQFGCAPCPQTQRNGADSWIRKQLRDTIIDGKTGFQISGNWEDQSGNDDQSKFFYLRPDMDHYQQLINYIQLAYELGEYWTKADVDKWIVTANKNWSSNSPVQGWEFLNFTGSQTVNAVVNGAQTSLGAHDAVFQARLNEYIVPNTGFNYTAQQGQLLYNQKVLNDGRPVYPTYYRLDGGLPEAYRRKILKKKNI